MPKAEYRSSIRSKNLIKKAVAKLIHEKDIQKITVSDIIREADISRGTFYAHFADVSSVIEQIECEEMRNLMDYVERFGFENIATDTERFIKLLCEYLSRDIEYYRMLTQSNILNNFIWRLVDVYYEKLFNTIFALKNTENKDEINLYLIYITSGAKTIILAWLNGEIKGTPSEIAKSLAKLIRLNQRYFK
ncbi:MAG: TetR/AcrR family transcriptional regulator C-terminal domain-containing protein [Clostridia bacterium]|nr:TetR/AcrR family transcriptional regulator C-terminal domain-containing protein [Clostridia bacterium]